jgi:hypothetical protein
VNYENPQKSLKNPHYYIIYKIISGSVKHLRHLEVIELYKLITKKEKTGRKEGRVDWLGVSVGLESYWRTVLICAGMGFR